MTIGFIKFPSIEALSNVNYSVKKIFEVEQRPTITYRGKVKLHGSNAAIRCDFNGLVTGQKRSSDVSLGDDNAGFAVYVETIRDQLSIRGESYVIFGEWAGPGIQKKVAVSQIEKKTFFAFAIYWPESDEVWTSPDLIRSVTKTVPSIEVIPWGTNEIIIDFRLTSSVEAAARMIEKLVDECDTLDPYIKDRYGIEGIGEGYVFVPIDQEEHGTSFETYHDYIFKAKGESHSVSKGEKVKIEIDPAILSGAETFADKFVTEARLQQGLKEACDGIAISRNIGPFMAWFGADVKKESTAELEVSGLEWKNVSKTVNNRARDWFILETEKALA